MCGGRTAAIRSEIAETRERMGETMEAIGYKTDVGARKDYVQAKKDAVTDKVQGAKESSAEQSGELTQTLREHATEIRSSGS